MAKFQIQAPALFEPRALRFAWHYAGYQLRLKYRYTSLGFLWNFLEPALYLVILSLVFSVVNRMNISDYAVFLFSALVPWRYFEKLVNSLTDSIVGGEWLLKKMSVSPVAFPLSRWLIATAEFGFSLTVMIVLFLFIKDQWTIHLVVLPLAFIPWAMLGLGVGMSTAVLYTFFRDVKPMVQMLLMLLFFSAPILFHAGLFESSSLQAQLMRWHPITYLAALWQKPVYQAAWPGALDWGVAFAQGLLWLAIGLSCLRWTRQKLYYYL
ncbi:MAG: hypothetical protein D6715_13950 [Calditrichaeota bacterium]|nr:MAG: hypothetical protein D6715_13950 [Calditrichota bacterium]